VTSKRVVKEELVRERNRGEGSKQNLIELEKGSHRALNREPSISHNYIRERGNAVF
jgi:hypothetical protein